MPQLVDNVPLRAAVARFAADPNQATYWEVLRNTLQGDILLDLTGSSITMTEDGSSIAEGSTLAFQGGTGPDGGTALFAFTRQEEVGKMHPDAPDDVKTLAQQAAATLEFANSEGYAWLFIDAAGPTCALQLSDVQFVLRTNRNDAVKEATAFPAGIARTSAVMDALAAGGQLLYGVNERPDGSVEVRTSTNPAGAPVAMAFTSAVEVVARGATDAWTAIDISRIISDALADPFAGLLINPGGPWVVLSPDELRAVQKRLPAPA